MAEMSAKKKSDEHHAANADRLFESVVEAFANVRHVTREKTKGFGSGSLKVNGKIFAVLSSKAQFVVKLPKERVDEMVCDGVGDRFVPRPGRLMKEWLVADAGKADWVDLAREAGDFVGRSKA